MKNACLILAHNEWGLLDILLSCLDDERNDIYVHIDKKVGTLPELHTEKAGLKILENRVDVRWGDLSMVEAEYALFEEAIKKGGYDYYHLLSGVDLPLKSQDYINDFLEKNKGKEFIGYTLTEITPEVVRKVRRWHLFPKDFRKKSGAKRIVRAGFLRIQELLGIERNKEIDFKKGSQWCSITEDMAKYFISRKDWVMKVFRNTFCSDEIVMQTLCWESPYRKNIYCTTDDGKGCMRSIGWRNGELVDWSGADYEKLKSSPALFARKFNSRDMGFIEKIKDLSI
ncbi:MAG: glycosyl transferase [Bacteroidales bacterium]|nr:glycosyl transferase [Bacteroidales bacterium]